MALLTMARIRDTTHPYKRNTPVYQVCISKLWSECGAYIRLTDWMPAARQSIDSDAQVETPGLLSAAVLGWYCSTKAFRVQWSVCSLPLTALHARYPSKETMLN